MDSSGSSETDELSDAEVALEFARNMQTGLIAYVSLVTANVWRAALRKENHFFESTDIFEAMRAVNNHLAGRYVRLVIDKLVS